MKKLVLRLLRRAGYELRPVGGPSTLAGLLRQVARLGFAPKAVVDVGAAHGQFTRACAEVFPQARYLLVEPLTEFAARLEALRPLADIRLAHAVAAAEAGERVLHVHDDLVGSSTYREEEGAAADGTERRVPAMRLDDLAREHGLTGSCLLKIDVQGAELDVLRGAPEVLASCELVVLEVSFFRFFKDGPLFDEITAAMKAYGFVIYDILGLAHRPLDGALSQADVAFVREGGLFRGDHRYATPEQRALQTKRLRQSIAVP